MSALGTSDTIPANRRSVYDAIPERVLCKIDEIEERAAMLQRQAMIAEAEAQDLRMQAQDIVEAYRMRIEREGWEVCRAEAEAQDMRAWRFSPLPGQGART